MGNQPTKDSYKKNEKKPKWKNSTATGPPLPPGRPKLVTGNSSTGHDAVTIHWEPSPQNGGAPVHGYIVENRRIGSQNWIRAVNMLIPTTELTINGLEAGWKYQFRVIAQNAAGVSEPSESSEALSVHRQRSNVTPPVFTLALPEEEAVVQGKNADLRVAFTSDGAQEVVWYRNGFELLNDGHHYRITTEASRSNLVIVNVSPADEGEIKCSVVNQAGCVNSATQLKVEMVPKVVLPSQYAKDGLIVEAGEVVRLKVNVEGCPTPTVQWTHNGQLIEAGPHFEVFSTDKHTSLKINSVERTDRGEYCVHALNKLGESTAAFLLTVTSRPSPPGRVTITSAIGNQVSLSFTEPIDDGGCKIGNYIIEYYRVGWDVWLKAATTRTLSVTLTDWILGSEYKFRAKAENPYGISEPSEESYLLFIPDVARGITLPAKKRSILEDLPKSTPSIVIRKAEKVDSETSTSPDLKTKKWSRNLSPVQPLTKVSDSQLSKENESKLANLQKKKYDFLNVDSVPPLKKQSFHTVKDTNERIGNSGELMLLLYPEGEKAQSKNPDLFEFDAETEAPPPTLSLSAPSLNTELLFPPLSRSAVSSTELIYEKAMAKFYQAVANEEIQQTQKNEKTQRETMRYKEIISKENFDRRKSLPEGESSLKRPRLGSLQEEIPSKFGAKKQKSGEIPTKSVTISDTVLVSDSENAYLSDYTDSTASSEDLDHQVRKVKSKLAQIEDGGLEPGFSYSKLSKAFNNTVSPYKVPEHGQAVNILSKPLPLPDPNFIPKPILKRPMSPESPNEVQFSRSSPKLARNEAQLEDPRPDSSPKFMSKSFEEDFSQNYTRDEDQPKVSTPRFISKSFEEDYTSDRFSSFQPDVSPTPPKRSSVPEKPKTYEAENSVAIDFYADLVNTVKNTRRIGSRSFSLDRAPRQALPESDEEEEPPKVNQTLPRSSFEAEKRILLPPKEPLKTPVEPRKTLRGSSPSPFLARPTSELQKELFGRQTVRGSSPNPPQTQSRDASLPRPQARDTSLSRPQARDTSLSRPQARDESLTRPSARDESLSRPQPRDSSLSRPTGRDSSQTRPHGRNQSRDPSLARPPSRDASLARPPSRDSSLARPRNALPTQDKFSAKIIITGTESKRLNVPVNRSRSTSPALRRPANESFTRSRTNSEATVKTNKTTEDIETEQNVKKNLNYTTDVVLLGFAAYIYLTKDAIMCIPILLLLIYRQLSDVFKRKYLSLKKPDES